MPALISVEHTPPEWMTRARCLDADPELFFPGIGQNAHRARAICAQCPVLDRCRAWVDDLENRIGVQPGVFAGLTERQRRALRGPQCAYPGCVRRKPAPSHRWCDEHRAWARRHSRREYDQRLKHGRPA